MRCDEGEQLFNLAENDRRTGVENALGTIIQLPYNKIQLMKVTASYPIAQLPLLGMIQ